MFAIVETSGRQYRVEMGMTITVDRIKAEVGDTITLDRVLLFSDAEVKVGTPILEGATVTAKVLGHNRGEKVITFKYRRRKRSRRRVGFRAAQTQLEIGSIEA